MGFHIFGFIGLVLLSVATAVFTFFFGVFPLHLKSLKKSLDARHDPQTRTVDYDKWLSKFSQLSNGILIGTALVIIVPEGVSTLYQKHGEHHKRDGHVDGEWLSFTVGASLVSGFLFMYFIDNIKIFYVKETDDNGNPVYLDAEEPNVDKNQEQEFNELLKSVKIAGALQFFTSDGYTNVSTEEQEVLNSDPQNGHSSATTSLHPFLIQTQAKATRLFSSLAPTWNNFHRIIISETMLIGLLLHSITDGIAFGSSYLTNKYRLQFVLFASILVHKFPTAFALGCVLVNKYQSKYVLPNQEFSPHQYQQSSSSHAFISSPSPVLSNVVNNISHIVHFEIFIFAASTAVSAIVTYLLVSFFAHNIAFFTAILLLFSGGSFLYVAVHILNNSGTHHEASEPRKITVAEQKENWCFNVLGMLIPLLVSLFSGDD